MTLSNGAAENRSGIILPAWTVFVTISVIFLQLATVIVLPQVSHEHRVGITLVSADIFLRRVHIR